MKTKTLPRTGRPRAFDPDHALDRALAVFWRQGYEGASLPDLTKAMGINRPSLYAAFGNKEALFRKALERYETGPAAYIHDVIAKPTARAVVEGLLNGAVDLLTKPGNPRGCLMVQGVLACSRGADALRRKVASRREVGVAAIRRRLQRAIAEGDLPSDADAAGLARLVASVMHGLAVEAASGASQKELRRVTETFLRTWPSR
jgi:AcrR family transcriptional regulator